MPHRVDAALFLRWMALDDLPRGVLERARSIMASSEFGRLRAAFHDNQDADIVVAGRSIAYVAAAPSWLCGMTTGPAGFILGRRAFDREPELLQTMLQELYRLEVGQDASGASRDAVIRMTDTAKGFAAHHWRLLCWAVHRKI